MRISRDFHSRSRGFTFIEIMLVVLIIGILTAVVVPRMVGQSDKARVSATRAQMEALKTALQAFEVRAGRFPTTQEGLPALVSKPTGLTDDEWEKVMNEVPRDAWKQEFTYKCPGEDGRDYDLISKGKDKQENTADDITNFSKDSNEAGSGTGGGQ